MSENQLLKTRWAKGLEIAKNAHIMQKGDRWIVPSQYGHGNYTVTFKRDNPKCTCMDFEKRGEKCKHIIAIELIVTKQIDQFGNVTFTKAERITYSQDWRAYNQAQTNEIKYFDILLKDLVANIDEPAQIMGRPRLNLKDGVFCAIQKVYSQLSSRRAYSLYRNAGEREQIEDVPSFNMVNKLLNREDLNFILNRLLIMSALPLKSVETSFAPDSSGFRTTAFNEYCKEKHHTNAHHQWIKAHVLVGVKTNIVVSARITGENGADCPQFKPLVSDAYENGFEIKEIPADMGYSSKDNYEFAQSIGATAYIPFKSNTSGKQRGSQIWGKMFHYFQFNKEEFMQHYHARSNVESTFSMIKAKFGDKLKSKKWVAQQNEMLCKLIAHNIVVVIHEMGEMRIKPDFGF